MQTCRYTEEAHYLQKTISIYLLYVQEKLKPHTCFK